MIEVIEKKSYKKSTWKNGQGSTDQIAICPDQANFPDDTFFWRISSAQIHQNCSFSTFEGYDRLLIVVSDSGLFLNGNYLKPLDVSHFSGEKSVDCRLEKNQAIDFGVIYLRDSYQAHMSLLSISKHEPASNILADGIHFFYLISGELQINDAALKVGDTIKLTDDRTPQFSTQDFASYIHVQISPLTDKPKFCKV